MKVRYITAIIVLILGLLVYFYNHQFIQGVKFESQPIASELIKSNEDLKKKETINILIIEGGGVRGLIPLYLMRYIEEQLGRPIEEFFDVFSGVSTGAIIATSLNIPDAEFNRLDSGKTLSKNEKLISIYENESEYIFSAPWYHNILTANGYLSPKFKGSHLCKVLKKNYSTQMNFTSLNNYVIIPSLDIHNGQLHLFKNRGDEVGKLPTNTLYQLVLAASSAEAYFTPVDFVTADGTLSHRYFADAAITANDPASIILHDVINEFPDKNYYVLILGSGIHPVQTMDFNYRSLKSWGKLRWFQDAIFSMTRSMDYQQIFSLEIAKSLASSRVSYDYLNIQLIDPFVGPFDYKSIDKLKVLSDRLIEENKAEIDRVIDSLEGE
ncbi:patatin-like phospholipase family protein [Microbulbifer sp. THAF38]|uniref:patatin-like phospholipase family protein n=1 Tax=Microbulbifer sp. THAF38 TaxID=2587856 RepID=UPI0012689A57|nr:patatin-like phospholipase family protein [Microbulbifer sp. THAF38]QFT54683.1 Patatin-like phospholipase [Microbulbifer sp. THAF38]